MIRTFGDYPTKKQASLVQQQSFVSSSEKAMPQSNANTEWGGMSEELRDEYFHKKLQEAFMLKQQQRNQEALDIYLMVLSQEFLIDSIVEKHIHMRFNALQNSGDVYERIGDFKNARKQYTYALKIKDKDFLIWSRLGFIEYQVFQNLSVAKACFQAAAQTCHTIDRRSAKINTILLKLAEIYFLEFDYRSSETVIDAIISRLSPMQPTQMTDQQSQTAVSAYLLKSFFLSLKNDSALAQRFQERACALKPQAKLADLEIIQKMTAEMQENLKNKVEMNGTVIRSTVEGQFIQLGPSKNSDETPMIAIEPSKESFKSAIEIIDNLLLQLAETCERLHNQSSNPSQELQQMKLNLTPFIEILTSHLEVSQSHQSEEDRMSYLKHSESEYWYHLSRLDASFNNQGSTSHAPQDSSSQNTGQAAQDATIGGKLKSGKGGVNAQSAPSRTLRRKPDSTETQMKQYNLNPLKDHMEFIAERYQSNINFSFEMKDYEEMLSTKEIMNAKYIFERGEMEGDELDNANLKKAQSQPNINSVWFDSLESYQQRFQLYNEILLALVKLQGKTVPFVVRALIRYFFENSSSKLLSNLVTFTFSSHLYRLFAFLSGYDFSLKSLDQLFGQSNPNTFQIILGMFEISLFNKLAIKEVKSTQLIYQREKMFEYFAFKEQEIVMHMVQQGKVVERVRLYYALMFYAFEIKNNMHASISYYQKLKNSTAQSFSGLEFNPVNLTWVGMSFMIDEAKVSDYGGVKITKAQRVKSYDEELIQLKMQEIEETKKYKAAGNINFQRGVKPEFVKFACFYLDQLCIYLQKAVENNETNTSSNLGGATQSSQISANFSTNEEKIKEMWSKLMYSVCRCPTSKLFKLLNSLFSILTAFQYLNKSFYEQFILKKLEFEPIFTELQERLKIFYNSSLLETIRASKDPQELTKNLKVTLIQAMGPELVENYTEAHQIDKVLAKLQVHMIRIMSCEFLFHHIIQNLQKLNEGQQLLQAYFQILFFIDLFLALIRSNESSTAMDLQETLRPVIVLIKRLDKISYKNNDVFAKAYFKMLVTALPGLLGLFNAGTVALNEDSETNDLLQLVTQLAGYFFSVKFNQADLNNESQSEENNGDQVMEGEDEGQLSEDEKKKYKLKCLAQMAQKSSRYWGVVLNQLMPSINQVNNQNPGNQVIPQIQYLYSSAGSIDIHLLLDMFTLCNLIAKGRLSNFGVMTFKDVSNIAYLIDVTARYLKENHKSIIEQGKTYKDNLALFVKSISLEGNPLTFFAQFQQTRDPSVSALTHFMFNVTTHLAFDNTPHQVVNATNSQKRKKLLEVALSNLNIDSKLLKNLRQISHLNLLTSSFSVDALLLHSYLLSEEFVQLNLSKLSTDYKKTGVQLKDKYHQALNTILICIHALFTEMRDNAQQLNRSSAWDNMNRMQLFKECFSQALFLVTTKLQANQYLIKRVTQSQLQMMVKPTSVMTAEQISERKAKKVKQLKDQGFILANICEKLEKLGVMSEDPRMMQGNKGQEILHESVMSIVETFLGFIQRSNTEKLSDKVKFELPSEYVDDLLGKINQTIQPFKARLDQVKLRVSFEYPYLQSLFNHPPMQQEQLTVQDFTDLADLSHITDIALQNRSSKGCLELFVDVLRRALHLGLVLRYQSNKLKIQDLNDLTSLYQSVTKTLTENKTLFRMMLPKQQSTKPKQEKTSSINVGDDQPKSTSIMMDDSDFQQEILLDNNISASKVRTEIFKSDEIPEFNKFDSTLHALYFVGDSLFQALLNHGTPYLWFRIRLQYALVKELQFETTINPIVSKSIAVNEKLAEMLTSLIQLLQTHEEYINGGTSWDTTYFSDERSKNLLSTLNHSEFALAELRIKFKSYYIKLNGRYHKYENIKEQFKRQLHLAKQNEKVVTFNPPNQIGGSSLQIAGTIELQNLFQYSKDKYLESIFSRIKSQFDNYKTLRSQLKAENLRPEIKQMLAKSFRELRDKMSVSKDSIPQMLKDIFELFVETHQKKSVLTNRKLIDETQKLRIRQAVLYTCAFCGPDSEFEQNKVSSRFLDLARIAHDEDYETEGLLICIKWYIDIINETKVKKDQETAKRLKAILDELERSVKEQAAARAQNFLPSPVAMNQSLIEGEDAQMARQVFNNNPTNNNE